MIDKNDPVFLHALRRFGGRLRAARNAHHLSPWECAELIGVEPSVWEAWERGNLLPRLDEACAAAQALNTTVEDLAWPISLLYDRP